MVRPFFSCRIVLREPRLLESYREKQPPILPACSPDNLSRYHAGRCAACWCAPAPLRLAPATANSLWQPPQQTFPPVARVQGVRFLESHHSQYQT